MNQSLFVIIACFAISTLQAQQITVIYNVEQPIIHRNIDISTSSNIDDDLRPKDSVIDYTAILEKKPVGNTFNTIQYKSMLRVDKQKSIYYPQEELTNDTLINTTITDQKTIKTIEIIKKEYAIVYKDLNTKTKVIRELNVGEDFLISEGLTMYPWVITDEVKTIHNYTCRKATLDQGDYKAEFWFTEKIPVGNGPMGYWGLPGLILEMKDKESHIVIDKIMFGLDGFVVEPPHEGRKMTRIELEDLPRKIFYEN